MDEITLFTTIKPADPPDGLGHANDAARRRLTEGMATAARRPAVTTLDAVARTRATIARPRRRRLWQVVTAASAAAAAAIVLPAVLPAGGGSFAGTAWAVERGPEGTVKVSVSDQFNDPAGLQRALRADGIRAVVALHIVKAVRTRNGPVFVNFCDYRHLDRAPQAVQDAVIADASRFGQSGAGKATWVIHPAAMPPDSLLLMSAWAPPRTPQPAAVMGLMLPVVVHGQRAPACVTENGPAFMPPGRGSAR